MSGLGRPGGTRPFTVFIIAGEESGDRLGAGLMSALRERDGDVRFVGVGGARMIDLGLTSLFPVNEVALVGLTAIIRRLPGIAARMRKTVDAVIEADPDVLVLIDVPGFNLRIGKFVRWRRPQIPIVFYVSPSVWAYRPGRARSMARFVDRILAILPFEPAVHDELGGPPCSYVGHPLIGQLDRLRPPAGAVRRITPGERVNLLVMPGSRRSEVTKLMAAFGETVALVTERHGPLDVVLPTVPHVAAEVRALAASWPVQPRIVEDEEEKLAAFRSAHAALVASGTATLELALAGVPMVVAYKLDLLVRLLRPLLAKADTLVLPNLITDTKAVPEFVDRDCTPERLTDALLPLLEESPERERQIASFARLESLMTLSDGKPSGRAAEIVLDTVRSRRLDAALGRKV
jgi:lipid-A-disaccharide synthase